MNSDNVVFGFLQRMRDPSVCVIDHVGPIPPDELEEAFVLLKQHPSLTKLVLNRNLFEPKYTFFLADALAVNCTLQWLRIAWNAIGEQGTTALCDALMSNKKNVLQHLNLCGCRIGTLGRQSVLRLLQSPQCHLRVLNLRFCALQNEGFAELCKVLQQDKNLMELNVESNAIRNLEPMVEVLRTNDTLQNLYLDFNQIGEWASFCGVMKQNKSIRLLSLSTNPISPDTDAHFADVLKVNSSLVQLRMMNLKVTLNQIIDSLRFNTHLKHFNITSTPWNLSGVNSLIEVLRCNSTLTYWSSTNLCVPDHSYAPLKEALNSNTSLRSIRLFHVDFDDLTDEISKRNEQLYQSVTASTTIFLAIRRWRSSELNYAPREIVKMIGMYIMNIISSC